MKILLIGFILIVIGLLLTTIKKKEAAPNSKSKYFKKVLLSAPEQAMYFKLRTGLPDHIILAQVAFSQMIGAKGGSKSERSSKWGSAKQSVADFVICDKAFNIIAVVELDDKTHKAEKDEARDQILLEAGIQTIRWKAVNLPDEEEIKQKVSSVNLK